MRPSGRLLCLLLLLLSPLAHAQKITLSPVPFVDYAFDNLRVAGQDTGGFFLLQSNLPLELERDRIGFKNRKYKLAYYRFNLSEVWTREVEATPGDASVASIIFTNGRMLVACAGEGKEDLTVYGRWIDSRGREAGNQAVHTFGLQGGETGKLKVIISDNQLLAGFLLPEYIDDDRQVLHFAFTDSTFTVLGKKTLSIPYGAKRFEAATYSLSNNGDLHMLGVRSVRIPGQGRKRVEDFLLYSSPVGDGSFQSYQLGGPGKEVTSASISFDNLNNMLVCAGFYSDHTTSAGAGVIYASLSMSGTDRFQFHSSPIDSDTRLKILGERNRNYDVGLVNYPIQKIILRNDGGAVIIAEAFYAQDYSYYDYFTQSYTRSVEYHYNNIVAASVNPNGTIHWLNVIRKNQVSTDDGGAYSSFCPVLTDMDLAMIYNSDISRSSEVMTSRITTTGTRGSTDKIRVSNKLLLYSRSGKQVSANEAIIPCISRKKLMLARISF